MSMSQKKGRESVNDAEQLREITALIQSSHSGPLPAPWTLEQYKKVSSEAVDFIFESARKEQEIRHWCSQEPLRQSGRAQVFALILTLVVVIVGGLLIFFDKSAEGLATILVPMGTILGLFVYRELRQKQAGTDASS